MGQRFAYEQVAEALRERITAGEFPRGSKLPSYAELVDAYGVSVTVVRAAVAALRADGLVSTHQGKGAYVRGVPEPSLLTRIERLEARLDALEQR